MEKLLKVTVCLVLLVSTASLYSCRPEDTGDDISLNTSASSLIVPKDANGLPFGGDLVNKLDDYRKRHLTYCVSPSFGEHQQDIIDAIHEAAFQWELSADIDFIYVPEENSRCNNQNERVYFSVEPDRKSTYAFFPLTIKQDRRVAFAPWSIDPWPLPPRLQADALHELGHVLGFAHEQEWETNPSGYHQLTGYDAQSRMNYGQTPPYILSASDREGVKTLYGPPRSAPEVAFTKGSYTAWAPGEPNNYNGHENCAFQWLNGNNMALWYDANCASSYRFSCKNNLDGAWKLTEFTGAFDAAVGEYHCQQFGHGYHFGVPLSDAENNALLAARREINATTPPPTWINYTDQDLEGAWQTLGAPWAAGEPNDYGGHEDCAVQWQFGGANNASWYDITCSDSYRFACIDRSSPTAPLWAIAPQQGAFDASMGERNCQRLGAHFHFDIPRNKTENDALLLARRAIHAANPPTVWINYTDQGLEGVWKGVSPDYTAWASGDPDNHNGTEHCAVQRTSGTDAPWYDSTCSDSYRFACKNQTNGAWRITDFEGAFDAGQGEYHCQKSFGANYHFAIPLSSAEDSALKLARQAFTPANPTVWLNYTDQGTEGSWKAGHPDWSWQYTAPNSVEHGHCAAMASTGRWSDLGCHTSLPVACRKPDGTWQVTTGAAPWVGAEIACRAEFPGSSFAVPENPVENESLRTKTGVQSVWLNLHDLGQDGYWVKNKFHGWAIGQPDNLSDMRHAAQGAGGTQWVIQDKSERLPIACKNLGTGEWHLTPAILTWDYKCADARCLELGARFLPPIDAEDNWKLYSAKGGNDAWINLTDVDEKGTWVPKMETWGWGPTEPNNWGGNEHCAKMMISSGWNTYGPYSFSQPSKWLDAPCNTPLKYACRNTVTNQWQVTGASGEFTVASAVCSTLGANWSFAIPQTLEDNQALVGAAGTVTEFWVNSTDSTAHGTTEGRWISIP